MSSHDAYIRRILDQLGSGVPVSQRSLSGELGIALGLTNLLVRRMMHKGWVQLVRVPPNRYRYFLTPDGLAEKARRSRAYFAHSVEFYAQTRDRIRQTFDAMSIGWENIGGPGPKQVVFFSAGEVAEIGYVCLQDTDLRLIGVVDDGRTGSFFGVPVHPVAALDRSQLAGQRFGALIVMSVNDVAETQALLDKRDVPAARVIWLT